MKERPTSKLSKMTRDAMVDDDVVDAEGGDGGEGRFGGVGDGDGGDGADDCMVA